MKKVMEARANFLMVYCNYNCYRTWAKMMFLNVLIVLKRELYFTD